MGSMSDATVSVRQTIALQSNANASDSDPIEPDSGPQASATATLAVVSLGNVRLSGHRVLFDASIAVESGAHALRSLSTGLCCDSHASGSESIAW